MRVLYLALVAAVVVVGGALLLVDDDSGTDSAEKYHVPGRSGTFSFDVYVDGGTIHVVLADYDEGSKTPRLFHRHSDDEGKSWSEPVRIDADATPAYLPYRGVDPQIAAFQETIVAVWTTAGDDVYGYGTGPLATALSSDGGATWRPGPNPSDDDLTTAHEFIDVSADVDGNFHLVWIDDRDDADGIRRGLRYTRSSDSGAHWATNATIDEHICGCCWTHLRAQGDSLYLLYRDEHPDPSDMKLAVVPSGADSWEARSVVGRFDWMQQGCPHTTGGLAWSHDRLHAVIQTGKEREAGIYYLASDDEGWEWSAPLRLAGVEGHYADLAAIADNVTIVWQEQRGTRTVIVATRSHDGGKSFSTPRVVSDTDASASYPRIVASSESFRAFWTESEDGRKHTWSSVPLDP